MLAAFEFGALEQFQGEPVVTDRLGVASGVDREEAEVAGDFGLAVPVVVRLEFGAGGRVGCVVQDACGGMRAAVGDGDGGCVDVDVSAVVLRFRRLAVCVLPITVTVSGLAGSGFSGY